MYLKLTDINLPNEKIELVLKIYNYLNRLLEKKKL
jgi:hypothetical protein